MCNKAVDNYFHSLEFVPECFMTQEMCHKAVNIYFSTITFAPECLMTRDMCDIAVNRWFFLYLLLFLIVIKIKKYVTELILKILF